MNEELEKRFITLESIVSCQDQMLEDLNKVVIEQNKEINKLQTEIDKVRSLVENLREEPDNRPPPHY
ncbi:MAG: SlyX family protein [Lentisphaeraceae bacterium]|nr:SlyX family protein [Lentisphaeraceae bacterium]